MSYKISLTEDKRYIVCRVADSMTVDKARRLSKEMDSLSRKHHIKRLLVDVRTAPNTSDVFENYDFAYQDMARLELQKDVCVAILADPSDKSHDFVETVTRNVGYNVRLFHDEETAFAWLDSDNSP